MKSEMSTRPSSCTMHRSRTNFITSPSTSHPRKTIYLAPAKSATSVSLRLNYPAEVCLYLLLQYLSRLFTSSRGISSSGFSGGVYPALLLFKSYQALSSAVSTKLNYQQSPTQLNWRKRSTQLNCEQRSPTKLPWVVHRNLHL